MNSTNTTVFLPVCDKTVTTEVGCDLSMPDYQPEVRRLLRVRVTVVPPSSYVGGGRAEFAGSVRFDIVYSGNDGGLYSVSTAENYELSAPLDREADIDLSDEIAAFCDAEPELTVGRVTAPRKLSLRCRLRAHIRAFGRHRFCERTVGESEGIQRLSGERECAWLTARAAESLSLSEEVVPEGYDGDVRVVCSEAAVTVAETVPSEEGVGCRGEAILKLLLCRDGAEELPTAEIRHIPFSVTVPLSGADADMSCRAVGCCTDISTEVTEDGRVLCELSAVVTAEGQKNVPVCYTVDMFSTERESGESYGEFGFPRAVRCAVGNFTQSVYEPLSSYGLAEGCEVADVSATASVNSVAYEKGHWVLSGDSRIHLLARADGEYNGYDLTLPFRYEMEGEKGVPMLMCADVSMVSGRARVEGGRLRLECEMAVSARLCVEQKLTALTEVRFGEVLEKPAAMTVAFPTRGETLWSLAKRYHAAPEVIARLNSVAAALSAPLTVGEPLVVNE